MLVSPRWRQIRRRPRRPHPAEPPIAKHRRPGCTRDSICSTPNHEVGFGACCRCHGWQTRGGLGRPTGVHGRSRVWRPPRWLGIYEEQGQPNWVYTDDGPLFRRDCGGRQEAVEPE